MFIQIAMELFGCLLLADFARRVAPATAKGAAAHATLWLAALCPFTAVYAANPLTEALTLFCLALALWAVAGFQAAPGWGSIGFHICGHVRRSAEAGWRAGSIRACASNVRYLALAARISSAAPTHASRGSRICRIACLRLAAICAVCRVDLAQLARLSRGAAAGAALRDRSRRSRDPGWDHWIRTWCLDFVSTYQVYWNVPGRCLWT